jgi:hypothetical protein
MQEPTEEAEASILTENVGDIPTEEAEASISTENAREGPDENLNHTFAARRKAAKRTLPWDLDAGELNLASPPPPQAEDVPAKKKPRLEEPFSAKTDGTATKVSSHDTGVSLPDTAAANTNDDHVDANPVKDTRVVGYWSPEEDAKMISAVANTYKTKWGKTYRTDWSAVAALVPDRTKQQCWSRWHRVLDPGISRVSIRKSYWTAAEDSKLKDAMQTRSDKDWAAVTELVPGRTRSQCYNRWKDILDPNIDRMSGRIKWSEDENSKLEDAAQRYSGKNWDAIAALVPGRTRLQCYKRWKNVLNPSIVPTTALTGKWTEDEDAKLKDSVKLHNGKDWGAISALVAGRTKQQCCHRWHHVRVNG